MEFRSQKATRLTVLILLACAALPAETLRYQVRHQRWGKDRTGTLTISPGGASFRQAHGRNAEAPKGYYWRWQDVQQFYLGKDRIVLLTYQDRPWRLGVDRQYAFRLLPGQDLQPAYQMLRSRLDQRFVTSLAGADPSWLWEIPVKRTGLLRGSEGVLRVGAEQVVYDSSRPEASRTWRYADIDNISGSGPFDLTITSFERDRRHYGSRKAFHFQLKEPLDGKRYQLLWRRLQRDKNLSFLNSILEERPQP